MFSASSHFTFHLPQNPPPCAGRTTGSLLVVHMWCPRTKDKCPATGKRHILEPELDSNIGNIQILPEIVATCNKEPMTNTSVPPKNYHSSLRNMSTCPGTHFR